MTRRAISFCLILLLLTGCGRRDESLAEVSGDVTFCGQPAIAEVLFEPLAASGRSTGRASTATSAADGRFLLVLDDTHSGAKIGKHRVTIRVQQIVLPGSEQSPLTGEVPVAGKTVGTLKMVQLSREVHSGINQFHFRLTL